NYFSQMAKLRQTSSVKDYIQQFQNLSLRLNDISEDHLNDLFLDGLKDNIQHDVRLLNQGLISKSMIIVRRVEERDM
ncbi:hypothetical protein KI387_041687, partial [Taxus chinensis]